MWQEHLDPCQEPHISEDIQMAKKFSAAADPKDLAKSASYFAKYCYMDDDHNNLYEQNYRNANWNNRIKASKIKIMPATKVNNIEEKQKNWTREDCHGIIIHIPPNDFWMNNPQPCPDPIRRPCDSSKEETSEERRIKEEYFKKQRMYDEYTYDLPDID